MRGGLWSALALSLVLAPLTVAAQAQTAEQAALREIYRELVEINTTDSVGDNTRAAEAMAARLLAAGFPAADVQVRPLWYLNHLQQPYREMQAHRITRAQRFHDTVVNLPCSVSLTADQIAEVVALVEAVGPKRVAMPK